MTGWSTQEAAIKAAQEIASKYLLSPTRGTMRALEHAYQGCSEYEERRALGHFRTNRKLMATALHEARHRGIAERCAARDPHPYRGGGFAGLRASLTGSTIEEAQESLDAEAQADVNQQRRQGGKR